MSRINLTSAFSIGLLSLGLSLPVAANTVTITAGPFSSVAGVTNTSFDSGSLPSNYTVTGPSAGVASASIPGVASQPTNDSTPYAYDGPGSSITATFSSGLSYFGLYWGSPDTYNTLTFTDKNGVKTVYGEGGTAVPGLVTNQTTAEYVNFFNSSTAWTSVTWTSSTSAFEFDNVATATPEPTSISLLAGGLLAIGAGLVRRRKSL